MTRLTIAGALVTLLGCTGSQGPPVSEGGLEWAAPEDTADGNSLALARHSTECTLAEPAYAVFAAGRFLDHAMTLADAAALLDRAAPDRRHGLIQLPEGPSDVDERCSVIYEGAEPPAPHFMGSAALAAAGLSIGGGATPWRLFVDPTVSDGPTREQPARGDGAVFDVEIGPPGADPVATTVLVSTGSTMAFLLAKNAMAAAALDRYEIAGLARLAGVGPTVECRRVAVRWRLPALGVDRVDVALAAAR